MSRLRKKIIKRKPIGKKPPHARGEGGNGGLRCNIEAVLKVSFSNHLVV